MWRRSAASHFAVDELGTDGVALEVLLGREGLDDAWPDGPRSQRLLSVGRQGAYLAEDRIV